MKPEESIVRVAAGAPASPGVVLATIAAETGGGVYTWTRYKGVGPASGNCTELNASTGISAGTRVVLHKAEGVYYFFFPVEAC